MKGPGLQRYMAYCPGLPTSQERTGRPRRDPLDLGASQEPRAGLLLGIGVSHWNCDGIRLQIEDG